MPEKDEQDTLGPLPGVNEIDDSSFKSILDDQDGSVRVHSGSGFRFVVPFPWRLHQILDDMDKLGNSSIISWKADGRKFRVINPTLLMTKVIPKYFKQKSFKSFQRQLHIYGFQRAADVSDQGAYYHEKFLKGKRKLSLEISRIKAPRRKRASSKSLSETNSMAPINDFDEHVVKKYPVVDTTEWLINAGVPFSAFDPNPCQGEQKHISELIDCAEEITSIFKS